MILSEVAKKHYISD